MKFTEKDLAKEIIDYLTRLGWEIFQEVEMPKGRCDIVAKKDDLVWAIECKTTFSLSVIEQADNHLKYANFVSVAVPKSRNGYFAEKICAERGIGVFRVYMGRHNHMVIEAKKPVLNEKARIKAIKLFEEQKTWCEAGSTSGGGHYTPFKATVRDFIAIVGDNDGIHLNDAVKAISHHYRTHQSARSCLKKFIGNVIPEIRIDLDNKLYLNQIEDK